MSEPAFNDARRMDANDRSKSWATRWNATWEPWEDEILMADWVRKNCDERDEVGISHRLERTIAACRERASRLRLKHGLNKPGVKHHPKTEPEYIGAQDDPDDQWWSPDYYK